jgi:agmatine/peptidylarginine deiminase
MPGEWEPHVGTMMAWPYGDETFSTYANTGKRWYNAYTYYAT